VNTKQVLRVIIMQSIQKIATI